MRIPNKFNGYSADNRRIYNDPATIIATVGSYAEAGGVAEAVAAAQAAAVPAIAAATAAPTISELAAQGGQSGILNGASATPTATATGGAGVPGFGAPVTPAEPLPPVEAAPAVTPPPPAEPLPPADAPLQNAANVMRGGQAGPIPGGGITAPVSGPLSPTDAAQVANAGVKTTVDTGGNSFFSSLQKGAKDAYDMVSQGAKDAYEAYKGAPAPLQYLSAGLAAKKYLFNQPSSGPKEYKGPHANMTNFLPGGPQMPSTYLYGANGGIMKSYAEGGVPSSTNPVEQMSNMNANATGGNMMYPMSQQHTNIYGTGINQRPMSVDMLTDGANNVDPYTGEQHNFADGGLSMQDYQRMSIGKTPQQLEDDVAQAQHVMAKAKGNQGLGVVPRSKGTANMSALQAAMSDLGALNKKAGIKATPMAMTKMPDPTAGANTEEVDAANGGIMYNLGGYSDGGRLLKGPGDGVSDSIPATIGHKQPARLADGEFVVPARIVSELGNGSTEAGARKLYAMMDRVQKARHKSVGKGKVAVNSKADKHLPA